MTAGQARAGTTDAERFNAVLHNTEEIIGTAILPTLNKYLREGAKWLTQMNESGKLQKDVTKISHDLATVVGDVTGAFKLADRVTGSFKNTIALLLGLKVVSVMGGWAKSIGLVGSAATTAEGKVVAMRTTLGALGPITLAPIVIPIIEDVEKKTRSKGWLGKLLTDVADPANAFPDIKAVASAILHTGDVPTGPQNAAGGAGRGGGREAAAGRARIQAAATAATAAATSTTDPKTGKPLTALQRNNFFDNAIARLLMRGGLGNLQQQLTALKQGGRAAAGEAGENEGHHPPAEARGRAVPERRPGTRHPRPDAREHPPGQQQAAAKRQAQAQKLHDRNQAALYAMLGLGPTGQPKVPTVKRLRAGARAGDGAGRRHRAAAEGP